MRRRNHVQIDDVTVPVTGLFTLYFALIYKIYRVVFVHTTLKVKLNALAVVLGAYVLLAFVFPARVEMAISHRPTTLVFDIALLWFLALLAYSLLAKIFGKLWRKNRDG